jgi:hypothetical protein
MGQIVGYVTSDEANAFAAYAESLSLDVSALANLLIRREVQIGRLAHLPVPPPGDRAVKITAHFKTAAVKTGFTDHAQRHGLRAGPAATRLYRAELDERWLEGCLAINHFDSG